MAATIAILSTLFLPDLVRQDNLTSIFLDLNLSGRLIWLFESYNLQFSLILAAFSSKIIHTSMNFLYSHDSLKKYINNSIIAEGMLKNKF